MGPVFRLGNKAGANGIHFDIVPFLIQRFRPPDSMIKETMVPTDAKILGQVGFP